MQLGGKLHRLLERKCAKCDVKVRSAWCGAHVRVYRGVSKQVSLETNVALVVFSASLLSTC